MLVLEFTYIPGIRQNKECAVNFAQFCQLYIAVVLTSTHGYNNAVRGQDGLQKNLEWKISITSGGEKRRKKKV